jgi:hypothetical protein
MANSIAIVVVSRATDHWAQQAEIFFLARHHLLRLKQHLPYHLCSTVREGYLARLQSIGSHNCGDDVAGHHRSAGVGTLAY